MALRKLLITGATGKQGGAVIDALVNSSAPFEILALTRNTTSPSALALAKKRNVKVIQGSLENPSSIFTTHSPIYGVFLMTVFEPGKSNSEEAQAHPVIDSSVANNVNHLIFTSVDRGGSDVSEQEPTHIEHFASKHRIEQYIKQKTTGSRTQWTILRPVAFMDNLVLGFQGKFFPAMWGASLRDEKKLQLISVYDIGVFAAKAFEIPGEFKGRAIGLAGDELTLAQFKDVFKSSIGYEMPAYPQFMGKALMWMMKDLGAMFKWFGVKGYGVDVQALRRDEPKLQDFGTWLKESSEFRKQ